jgi:TldD protein
VLEAALTTGADFAELYMEDTSSNALSLRSGEVDSATSARSVGAGVRVFRDFGPLTPTPPTSPRPR